MQAPQTNQSRVIIILITNRKIKEFKIKRTRSICSWRLHQQVEEIKMKSFFVIFAIFLSVFGEDFIPNDWEYVKSPLEAARHREFINQLFPPSPPVGKVNRGGRIAGGQLAQLGQFKHQALLLTRDDLGDDYVCGGSIISHNWILTVSHSNIAINLTIKSICLP